MVTLLCVIFSVHTAGASKASFPGEQQVLLHKIINWWYFAPAGQSVELYGESITYENRGNTRVDGNLGIALTEIVFSKGCAEMLSFINPCKSCSTKISVPSVWISQAFLPDSKATLIIEELARANICSIILENVQNEKLNLLKDSQI